MINNKFVLLGGAGPGPGADVGGDYYDGDEIIMSKTLANDLKMELLRNSNGGGSSSSISKTGKKLSSLPDDDVAGAGAGVVDAQSNNKVMMMDDHEDSDYQHVEEEEDFEIDLNDITPTTTSNGGGGHGGVYRISISNRHGVCLSDGQFVGGIREKKNTNSQPRRKRTKYDEQQIQRMGRRRELLLDDLSGIITQAIAYERRAKQEQKRQRQRRRRNMTQEQQEDFTTNLDDSDIESS